MTQLKSMPNVEKLVDLTLRRQSAPQVVNVRDLIDLSMRSGEYIQAARQMAGIGDVTCYAPSDLLGFKTRFPEVFLNIGGGPRFCYPLWATLDGVKSPLNPNPIQFTATTRFPFSDARFDLIYSSHALEHLDPPTAARVLSEARRVVKGSGALVFKLPDFTRVLEEWKRGNDVYFGGGYWDFATVTPTLASRGGRDSLLARAAYIFCGFWNKEFGNLFDGARAHAPGAYNGPAVMDEQELAALLNHPSPNYIAAKMREFVLANETDFTFNHQNAWSREEFADELARVGFELLSSDDDRIAERFDYIPGILQMKNISTYYFALPRGP